MYDVTIKFALNGFVARIGCQRVVFTNREKMLAELEAYLKNPDELEKKYLCNSMNSGLMGYRTDTVDVAPQHTNPVCDSADDD